MKISFVYLYLYANITWHANTITKY